MTHALSELNPGEKTLKRAQWEAFEFAIEAPGLVRVTNGSYGAEAGDHEYLVNVVDGVPTACECEGDTYRPPCKHRAAVALREPILKAATADEKRAVATDGGQVLDDDVVDLAEEYGCAPVDEELPAITEHVEPEAQGGATYIRCERCETEVIGTDPDRLVHREGCPHVDPGDPVL